MWSELGVSWPLIQRIGNMAHANLQKPNSFTLEQSYSATYRGTAGHMSDSVDLSLQHGSLISRGPKIGGAGY